MPVIYKDFLESHVDFEPGLLYCNFVSEGMVEDTLGDNGKPVAADRDISDLLPDTDDVDEEDTDDFEPVEDLSLCGKLEDLASWYDNSDEDDPAIEVYGLRLFDNGG